MSESEICRVTTYHKTQVFVDAGLKLIHKAAGSNASPLYAKRTEEGAVILFVLKDDATDYITHINNDCTVALASEPASISVIDNPNGSITFNIDNKFLSARKTGTFSLMPKNLSWEHLTLSPTNLLSVAHKHIFTVRTFHNTKVYFDGDHCIRHKRSIVQGDLPLYAQKIDDDLSLFVVMNGVIKYISVIDCQGNVVLSEERQHFVFVHNILNNSVSIVQDEQYLSARKGNDLFTLAPLAKSWEYFFLDEVDFLKADKCNVILVVWNIEKIDEVLVHLNWERINLKAIFVNDNDTETTVKFFEGTCIPIRTISSLTQTLDDIQADLWLLSGGDFDALKNVSMYLQEHGISRDKIINIEPKMNITPTWLTNVKYAIENNCDFIATGDIEMVAGLDITQISGQNGVNLSAEGQDLYQSYLIIKYLLERGIKRDLKFVLMCLTSETLYSDDERYFYSHGLYCQYIFKDSNLPLEDKIVLTMINSDVSLSTIACAPNQTTVTDSLRENCASQNVYDKDTPKKIDEKRLTLLEDCIRMCNNVGVKVIGIVLPRQEQFFSSANILGHICRCFEYKYNFTFIDLSTFPLSRKRFSWSERINSKTIDLSEVPGSRQNFSDSNVLNSKGAKLLSTILNYHLFFKNVLPIDKLRSMSYKQLYDLQDFLFKDDYYNLLLQVFTATLERIKNKDTIRVGFILHDSAIWCGDRLYNLFAQNKRYEPIIFLFLRRNLRNDLVTEHLRDDVSLFKSKGFSVLDTSTYSVKTIQQTVAQQDILIYLMPYFTQMPNYLWYSSIAVDTLIVYMPYSLDVSSWAIKEFAIYSMTWKMFASTKELFHQLLDQNYMDSANVVYSGAPKMDESFRHSAINFDWKTTQSNAIKIIWAPHHSIKQHGGQLPNQATFQWNYEFFYEYAKAHPETSWVVKPHPDLMVTAVREKVFPTVEAFEDYLKKWNELPNAQVVTGAYYHSIFASSDGMILDSCSFIAEYQYFDKPMLFLTREDATKLNVLGRKIVNANYHVDGKDFDGIKHFIDDVLINKNDPQAEARRKVFDDELNYYKDNGMLASDMIFKTVDDALSK